MELLEQRRLLTASYVADQLIVQFGAGASDQVRDRLRSEVGVVRHESIFDAPGQADLELISLAPGRSVDDVLQKFNNNPAVAYAEPNWVLTKQAVSNDPKYLDGSLWGMYGDGTNPTNGFGSQAGEAWAAGNTGSQSVIVGVIDEGIDFNHPDLAANIWTNPYDAADGVDNDGNGYVDDIRGWDFYENNNTIYDGSTTDSTTDEHGTHVAGTIGGVGGNGVGVAGVNWSVQMISGKFLGPNGGSIANAIKAVDYFTDLKTRLGLNIVALNNSWGGGGFSQAMQDAITRAAKQNILFIAAAGNGGSDQVGDNNDSVASYPSNYNTTAGAGYDSVVAVAAINSTGGLASFSNYGSTTVDLGAPGMSVLSTTPNGGYIAYSGTSMATPHVTGAAALYAAAFPGASAQEIRKAILDAAIATPTSSLSGKTVTGGRLNVGDFFRRDNDLAVTGVSTSSTSVTQGGAVNVTVTVKNTGKNATAAGTTVVTLTSDNGTAGTTDDFTIGRQTVAGGLLAGDSTPVNFTWDTQLTGESAGNHVLTASLPADDYTGNNAGTAPITVVDPNAPKTPLYLTVPDAGTVTLGGLSVQNEDIVYYDGTNYSLFFDGTPELGGSSGGFAIDAVAIISDNEFLISVDQYGGLNRTSLTVYDEDVIRFKRNSASDAWAASMYFDGSDVGLSTSLFAGTGGAEGVDAFELLPDGRLLVSTKGNFSVSGVRGADEDVIAFKPTRLGSTTKGSWAMYFDGSVYGLGDGGENEDVDGMSVDGGGKLYLSTAGGFTVPTSGGPLSGTGADVFVFDPAAKTYSPNLYFAGSTLGGKNLFSVDLPPDFVGPAAAPVRMGSALTAETAARFADDDLFNAGTAAYRRLTPDVLTSV